MIASVRGTVLTIRPDSVVVEVGGVGLLLQATPTALTRSRVGEAIELATTLVVREDALTLYGFADQDERDTFDILRTVSGVGPRLALAMLAVHRPDDLRGAVAAQDLSALIKVPGIGRKGAQRLVLELADRLGPVGNGAVPPAEALPGTSVAGHPGSDQVIEALVGLGWQNRPATEAVHAVLADGAGEAMRAGDVAQVLRAALSYLGQGR
jgi:Holliday junction DNA helicase RuvA